MDRRKLIICLQVCSWRQQSLKIVLTMTVMMKLKMMALNQQRKNEGLLKNLFYTCLKISFIQKKMVEVKHEK